MNPTRRVIGALSAVVVVALASCAAQNAGGDAATEADGASPGVSAATASVSPDASTSASPEAEASASEEAAGTERAAIDDILTDPAAFEGREIEVLENVEQVYVDGTAFMFDGIEAEGQLLVVVTPDAPTDKEPRVDRVVAVAGTLVPFTAEDLEAAGAGIGVDDEALADFEGDAVLVATAVRDPLAP